MGIDVREVVASYVLGVSGHTVHARITADINGSDGFQWEISHYQGGVGSGRKPVMLPVESRKQALEQIIAYAQGFDPQYSPIRNNSY
jgi:hypothetical protein